MISECKSQVAVAGGGRPGAEEADDDEDRYLTDLVAAGDPRAGGTGQVEAALDGRHDDAQQAVGQALHAVGEACECDEADDVVERLQPAGMTVAAAVPRVRISCFSVSVRRRPL